MSKRRGWLPKRSPVRTLPRCSPPSPAPLHASPLCPPASSSRCVLMGGLEPHPFDTPIHASKPRTHPTYPCHVWPHCCLVVAVCRLAVCLPCSFPSVSRSHQQKHTHISWTSDLERHRGLHGITLVQQGLSSRFPGRALLVFVSSAFFRPEKSHRVLPWVFCPTLGSCAFTGLLYVFVNVVSSCPQPCFCLGACLCLVSFFFARKKVIECHLTTRVMRCACRSCAWCPVGLY